MNEFSCTPSTSSITLTRTLEAFALENNWYMYKLQKSSTNATLIPEEVEIGITTLDVLQKAKKTKRIPAKSRKAIFPVSDEQQSHFHQTGEINFPPNMSIKMKRQKYDEYKADSSSYTFCEYNENFLVEITSGLALPKAIRLDYMNVDIKSSKVDLDRVIEQLLTRDDVEFFGDSSREHPTTSIPSYQEDGALTIEAKWIPKHDDPIFQKLVSAYLEKTFLELDPAQHHSLDEYIKYFDPLDIEQFRYDLLTNILYMNSEGLERQLKAYPNKVNLGISTSLLKDNDDSDTDEYFEDFADEVFDSSIVDAQTFSINGKVTALSTCCEKIQSYSQAKYKNAKERVAALEESTKMLIAYGAELDFDQPKRLLSLPKKATELLQTGKKIQQTFSTSEERLVVFRSPTLYSAIAQGIDLSSLDIKKHQQDTSSTKRM